MKLDRLPSSTVLMVALAVLLPAGAAQATDLYDSLKTLNPAVHATDKRATSPMSSPPSQPDYSRGAEGPYRSGTSPSDQPPSGTPTDEYRYQTAPAPSEPTVQEKSP